MTKADQIRLALCDPAAPWYGSDLVPLVADYLDEAEQALKLLQHVRETGSQVVLPPAPACLVEAIREARGA
jgi:hypothetical protein